MDEEGTIEEVRIQPRLHDRWSLLTLAVAFTGDVLQIAADYSASAAMMAAQHARQKNFDHEFTDMMGQ